MRQSVRQTLIRIAIAGALPVREPMVPYKVDDIHRPDVVGHYTNTMSSGMAVSSDAMSHSPPKFFED